MKAEDQYDTTILTSQPQVINDTDDLPATKKSQFLLGSFLVSGLQDGREANENQAVEKYW